MILIAVTNYTIIKMKFKEVEPVCRQTRTSRKSLPWERADMLLRDLAMVKRVRKSHWSGIINYAETKISNGVLE